MKQDHNSKNVQLITLLLLLIFGVITFSVKSAVVALMTLGMVAFVFLGYIIYNIAGIKKYDYNAAVQVIRQELKDEPWIQNLSDEQIGAMLRARDTDVTKYRSQGMDTVRNILPQLAVQGITQLQDQLVKLFDTEEVYLNKMGFIQK